MTLSTEMQKLNEAIDVVKKLRYYIWDKYPEGKETKFYVDLCVSYDGNVVLINYLGQAIWNSEDDERHFEEGKDWWEPLLPFIVNLINEIHAEMKVVKFDLKKIES